MFQPSVIAAVVAVPDDALGVDPHRQAGVALVAPGVAAARAQRLPLADAGVAEPNAFLRQKIVMHIFPRFTGPP